MSVRVTWGASGPPDEPREPCDLDRITLAVMYEQHCEADHGLHAISALVFCHEARLALPRWVVDWLGERFGEWLDDETRTLDQALRVSAKGRGRQDARKEYFQHADREIDFWRLHLLHVGIGVSIEKAAELVYAKNVEAGNEKRGAAWLVEGYTKEWRARFIQSDRTNGPPEVDREGLLSQFPDHALRVAGLK